VIAGTHSGVGKTSLSVGLIRTLSDAGLRVQAFKVGPDFLDPTYLSLASGRCCYNLDGWMMGHRYVLDLFARASADADVAVIEGAMGLFDGTGSAGASGSTAEIARWLDAPMLLVVDAEGMAGSLAPLIKGFSEFDRSVRLAAVVANRTGSQRHRDILDQALRSAGLPLLAGAIPKGSLPGFKSRHLGLWRADEQTMPAAVMGRLADACRQGLDIETIVQIVRSAGSTVIDAAEQYDPPGRNVRIGIARDLAFQFYYPDNLEALRHAGAEIVPFSPISDSTLPSDLAGLYVGGGYPEEHAEALASNRPMLRELRSFAASGRPLYAECGGLMYLTRQLRTADGTTHDMVGILPAAVRMLSRLRTLGHAEVTLAHDSLWGPQGTTFRGHEYHYSELAEASTEPRREAVWQTAYVIERTSGRERQAEGFQNGNVLASYVHGHFASRPELLDHFLNCCEDRP